MNEQYQIINDDIENNNIENYVIISKNINDILNDIDFNNEDERLMCESIIDNLESYAAAEIRNMKIVSLPSIGCVRINPVKRKLRDAKLHLSTIRRITSKENYKQHVKELVSDFYQELNKKDAEKLIITKIRRHNKKKYDKLYKKYGKGYAEMFIFAIKSLKEVPFDEEWEELYQQLSS